MLPHSISTSFYQQNRRESFESDINLHPYRDRERELYERQVDFELELENERFVSIQNLI